MSSRHILVLALLAGTAVGVSGCDTIKEASGSAKDSPDEFAVVTKAPLVIPPDFNLRPPAPGAAATNQVEPTQAAQNALFNADPSTVAASLPPTMSMGERYLLASAGVQNADPGIRQQIAADTTGMRGSDDSFTDGILFGAPSPPAAAPLDADAEARRLDAARTGGTGAAAPAPGAAPPPPPAPGDSDKDGGWISGLWPF